MSALRVALALVSCATLSSVASAQQKHDSLPPGVTPQMVQKGEEIFKGPGLCAACHGPDAKGLPGMGANLTAATYIHSKGTYEDIVQQIAKGVAPGESKSGGVMPPKGGSGLSDDDVKAVAAYVWTLHMAGVKAADKKN